MHSNTVSTKGRAGSKGRCVSLRSSEVILTAFDEVHAWLPRPKILKGAQRLGVE